MSHENSQEVVLPHHTRRVRIIMVALVMVFFVTGCGLAEIPENVRRNEALSATRYPWTAASIDEESKAKLCHALQLDANDVLCRPGEDARAADLMRAVQQRFPVKRTQYREVENVLQEFPKVVEESRSPEGVVTGRTYAYLLTQFKGFCVYFDVNLNTDVVDRVDNTKAPGIFDGPIPEVCGPAMRPR